MPVSESSIRKNDALDIEELTWVVLLEVNIGGCGQTFHIKEEMERARARVPNSANSCPAQRNHHPKDPHWHHLVFWCVS